MDSLERSENRLEDDLEATHVRSVMLPETEQLVDSASEMSQCPVESVAIQCRSGA